MARQGWVRGGITAAATATALLGSGVLAGSASAHVPAWTIDCSSVHINLVKYNADVHNTVTVKVAGTTVLGPSTFGESFQQDLKLQDHGTPLDVELIVESGDGNGALDEHKTAEVCPGHETSAPPATSAAPSSPAASSPAPSSAAPSTPAASGAAPSSPAASGAAPSSSAPVAAVSASASPSSGPGLAETGASSSTPVIAGAAVAVVALGGGLLVLSRRRRGARS
ncbi:LAETG motif-containing sortase-dependent surface protein [Peterkaempfera griseoplana]|uniref:LAETG motif-containing sortase-dependent surface protein n=1 Tax=Peterkaempfera griseoplana TaxID=66896 RepID=UPI0007C83234|nr:LAETG motif-containing sortase-dependent surface protein [Peterkaempfera griseoplana]